MKNHNLKNKLLQKLYKPYKSKINACDFIKELEEIEKILDEKIGNK